MAWTEISSPLPHASFFFPVQRERGPLPDFLDFREIPLSRHTVDPGVSLIAPQEVHLRQECSSKTRFILTFKIHSHCQAESSLPQLAMQPLRPEVSS